MNWEDPIVADVRRIREELSSKFDFEVAAIFADLRARQSGVGDRLVRLKGDRQSEETEAPERPTTAKSKG